MDSYNKNAYTNPCFPNQTDSSVGKYWPIIAIVVAVFLARTEVGSQNCSIKCCNKQLCNHNSPLPLDEDTEDETIDKMITSLRRHHTIVGWRRAILASIIISIIILMIFNRGKMVHGFTFLITTVLVFVGIYFTSVWFSSSWFLKNDREIEKSLRQYQDKINKI